MNLAERIFTRESAKRHLLMLIPFFLVIAWTYVLFALLKGGDWTWYTSPATQRDLSDWYTVGMLLGLLTGLAVAIYWNARAWMLPYIIGAFLNLLGAIPLVNLFIPFDMRHSWLDSICDLVSPEEITVTRYYDSAGRFMYELSDELPFIIAIPLGIITSVLGGVLGFVLNILAALAIPVFSPIILVVILQILSNLLVSLPAVSYTLGIIGMLTPVFLFIVHPVISFKID